MSREVIQDFLNLAGVVGIALTNRRMRPYFYGLDAVLDRTKQALGQGVLQVVENVPEGFESFEFHFAGHVVFIYKLTHGLVLLVLTDHDLKSVDYHRGITKIKYLIETDTYNTVAYFKLLLGSVTQHSLPSSTWNANAPAATTQRIGQDLSTTDSLANPKSEAIAAPASANPVSAKLEAKRQPNNSNQVSSQSKSNIASNASIQTQPNINNAQTPPRSASTSAPTARAIATNKPIETTDTSNKSVSAKTDAQEYKLDELLIALNKLSNFTTQYLGKVVVTNYWKSSRPDSSWLAEFEIDRSGQISHPKQAPITCNPQQLQQIQSWAAAYVKRCKQVIRNFDQMLDQDCLDSRQKQILF